MASTAQNNTPKNEWLCTQTRRNRIEFEWKIDKFHQLPQKNGEVIYSPVFPNNSAEQWKVEIWPQGFKKEDAKWISVFLCPATDKLFGIKIQCEFIISQCNEVLKTDKFTYQFEKLIGWGNREFVERSKLSVKDDPTDTITINCKIEVLGTYITSSFKTESPDIVVPFEERKNRITNNFQSLYKNLKFTDFTIICGDKTFPTHKLILASRYPVFAAMFEHEEVEENVKNELKIEKIGPAIVERLLEFIYTDNVSKIEELAHDLLAAAEQYGLEDLKNLCEETLYKSLDEDNAVELVALANLHNAQQLKKYAMQCIAAHPESVLKSEAFKSVELTSELSKEIIRALVLPKSEESTN